MAAASATPRRDMYLTVLAGRAVTALGRLATDTSAWNEEIESGLRDGISYCRAVRLKAPAVLNGATFEKSTSALKRSVEDLTEHSLATDEISAESERVEEILRQVISRQCTPDLRELMLAIEFLRKTATDR